MGALWEALHESLMRSVTTLEADRQFERARQTHSVLSRFLCVGALVAYCNDPAGDLYEKDQIYRLFVRTVQERAAWRELATALLWLGLRPGLDGVYGRHVRDFQAPEELVSEISFLFSDLLARIDLTRVRRLAATLVRNVQRDVREHLRRRRDEMARSFAIDPVDGLRDERSVPPDAGVHGCLPCDPGDPASLRGWLATVVGSSADLIIEVVLAERSQREVAGILGVSHDAVRKRFQRALAHVRRMLRS